MRLWAYRDSKIGLLVKDTLKETPNSHFLWDSWRFWLKRFLKKLLNLISCEIYSLTTLLNEMCGFRRILWYTICSFFMWFVGNLSFCHLFATFSLEILTFHDCNCTPLWTDRCEIITFPHTTYAVKMLKDVKLSNVKRKPNTWTIGEVHKKINWHNEVHRYWCQFWCHIWSSPKPLKMSIESIFD